MVVQHPKAKIATLIGFTVICLLVFVYLYQATGGRLGFSSSYSVSAVMPTTFNLVPQSDVRAAGVKVGSVDSVTPHGQNALVTFTIDTHNRSFPPIYKNATTQVRIKTLVGESYLSLDPGTPSAGKLPNGGTLPLRQAAEAVPLEKVLNMLDPATRKAVRQNMLGLGAGLRGRGAQLNTLFGSLQPTVANGDAVFRILDPERAQVASLIADTGTVMQALGERTTQFRGLVVDAKTTAQAVASRADQLRRTLDVLPSTLIQAQHTVAQLSSFSGRATPVFANLRTASADLSSAIRQLAPTAANARVLFRQLSPFLTVLQPLLTQLRPAASKLRTVIVPLQALLRQADPALAYLTSYAQEFGSFFSNVNAAVNSKDALGNRGRVFAMGGINQFTDLTATEQKLVDAMVKAGSFGLLTGTRKNPYPKPGTAGAPNLESNFRSVPAGR